MGSQVDYFALRYPYAKCFLVKIIRIVSNFFGFLSRSVPYLTVSHHQHINHISYMLISLCSVSKYLLFFLPCQDCKHLHSSLLPQHSGYYRMSWSPRHFPSTEQFCPGAEHCLSASCLLCVLFFKCLINLPPSLKGQKANPSLRAFAKPLQASAACLQSLVQTFAPFRNILSSLYVIQLCAPPPPTFYFGNLFFIPLLQQLSFTFTRKKKRILVNWNSGLSLSPIHPQVCSSQVFCFLQTLTNILFISTQ